jgi:hypothetical protein
MLRVPQNKVSCPLLKFNTRFWLISRWSNILSFSPFLSLPTRRSPLHSRFTRPLPFTSSLLALLSSSSFFSFHRAGGIWNWCYVWRYTQSLQDIADYVTTISWMEEVFFKFFLKLLTTAYLHNTKSVLFDRCTENYSLGVKCFGSNTKKRHISIG